MLIIGFTGTRHGMTWPQATTIVLLIKRMILKHGAVHLHHGDCLGADVEFHLLCAGLDGIDGITIHPPSKPDLRAFCPAFGSGVIRPERPYMLRNRNIASVCDGLIAAPRNNQRRGGTWSTVAIIQKKQKPNRVVKPDGCYLQAA